MLEPGRRAPRCCAARRDLRAERRQSVLHAAAGAGLRPAVAQLVRRPDGSGRRGAAHGGRRARRGARDPAGGCAAAVDLRVARRRSVRAGARVRDRRAVAAGGGGRARRAARRAPAASHRRAAALPVPAPARAPRRVRDEQGRLATHRTRPRRRDPGGAGRVGGGTRPSRRAVRRPRRARRDRPAVRGGRHQRAQGARRRRALVLGRDPADSRGGPARAPGDADEARAGAAVQRRPRTLLGHAARGDRARARRRRCPACQAHVRVRCVRALPRTARARAAAARRGAGGASRPARSRGRGRPAGPCHRIVLHRRARSACSTWPDADSPPLACSASPG